MYEYIYKMKEEFLNQIFKCLEIIRRCLHILRIIGPIWTTVRQ